MHRFFRRNFWVLSTVPTLPPSAIQEETNMAPNVLRKLRNYVPQDVKRYMCKIQENLYKRIAGKRQVSLLRMRRAMPWPPRWLSAGWRSTHTIENFMKPSQNYGCTDRVICENVVKELNLSITVDELERDLEQMAQKVLPRAPLQKGAERLLKHLHKSGVPIALATNSTRRAVRLHVAAKPKLFGLFHHMVCATDPGIDRGKPFPDIYLAAAAKFPDNPQPIKCLVFEDSIAGLEAGVSAGMQVVMIPATPLPREYAKKPTLTLKSLLEFKPEIFGLPPFLDRTSSTTQKKKSKVFF